MSKIDEYNKIKYENTRVIEELHLSQRRNRNGEPDSSRNDKGCLKFYNNKVWDTDMNIYIHSCYGYYGSSSAYPINGDIIKTYLLRSLNQHSQFIVDEAIKMLKEDIEKARKDAENEAREVLGDVSR